MSYYSNQPIRFMTVDENGKQTIRDLYDIEAKEDEEGNIEVTGSYIPDYEELYESNYRMAVIMDKQNQIIDKAIEYIRNNSYRFLYYEETDEGQIDLSKCKYRITPLRATKVKQLLDILKGSDKE